VETGCRRGWCGDRVQDRTGNIARAFVKPIASLILASASGSVKPRLSLRNYFRQTDAFATLWLLAGSPGGSG